MPEWSNCIRVVVKMDKYSLLTKTLPTQLKMMNYTVITSIDQLCLVFTTAIKVHSVRGCGWLMVY